MKQFNTMRNTNELKSTTSLEITINEATKNKLNKCEANGIFYGAIPVVGDSMTCNDKEKSIEDGNKLLVCEFVLPDAKDCEIKFWNLPTRKPMVFQLDNGKGQSMFCVKTVTFRNFVGWQLQLSSYNPKHKPFWVPMEHVKRVFEIIQVIKE